MDQSIKQLFLQTLSPHESIRNGAEKQLKEYEASEDFINYVRNVLMKNTAERNVQQIASLYFMNTITKNWKLSEMVRIVKDLQDNILNYLKTDDKNIKNAYLRILNHILENSEKEDFENLFKNSEGFLKSSDFLDNKVAFLLYEETFKNDKVKFGLESSLFIVFDNFGQLYSMKFSEYLNKGEYGLVGLAFKILSKTYSQHSLPEFLKSVDVYNNYLNIALYVICLDPQSGESFMKMQRWTAYFVYKTVNKGVKKYFMNHDLVAFIRNENILTSVYSAFTTLLTNYLKGLKYHSKVPVICADFFSLFASSKYTKLYVKSNYTFLIKDFILPTQAYDEDIKERFEYYEDDYLRMRYNYNGYELRDSTSELFEDIIRLDKNIEIEVVNSLILFLNQNSDEKSLCMRFGIIGLLANVQKSLISVLKDVGYHSFIKNYIFEDLKSKHLFLVSQALYFLSLSESIEISDESLINALNLIVGLISGENKILAVEACLALNVFFYNVSLKNSFKPIIAKIFEQVLIFSKIYFLESLSSLMDSIIDCFTEEITFYAPTFVDSLCSGFLEAVDASEKDNDKFSALSGSLTTIEKLIITASDKPEIVDLIYKTASKIVFYIFKYQKTDYYQEGFDIMNSFLFVLQNINESMFEIFNLILSSDKEELIVYPKELGDLVDNYLSYGKDKLVTAYSLNLIFGMIDVFMPLYNDSSDIYDEDYETSCRIIDSLMLNGGAKANSIDPTIIPTIVNKIVSNYNFISDIPCLCLFSIESLMNCYIVSPESCFLALGSFVPRFFDEIVVLKEKFTRVYDKKLFILFFGTFFKQPESIPLNYPLLVDAFVEVLNSLPAAIFKRNKLKQEAENDEDYESDYTAETLPEDIYFETILDNFDAFGFTQDKLSNIIPKSFGGAFISNMSSDQVSKVKSILDNNK